LHYFSLGSWLDQKGHASAAEQVEHVALVHPLAAHTLVHVLVVEHVTWSQALEPPAEHSRQRGLAPELMTTCSQESVPARHWSLHDEAD